MLLRSDLPGRRMGISIIVVLLFLPLYLQASAWQAGFGQEGWYSAHGGGEPWLSGWNAAVWVHTLAAIPWVVLFAGLGLRIVEPALEEQALLDGTPWQVFRRVTLPACWPALGLAAVWVAMFTAGEMTVTSIFSVRTYAEEVFNQIATHDEAAGAMAALLPGILGTLVLLGLGMFCCVRLARPRAAAEPETEPSFRPGGVALATGAGHAGRDAAPGRRAAGKPRLQGRRLGLPDGCGPGADLVGRQVPLDHPPGAVAMPPGVPMVAGDRRSGGHGGGCGSHPAGLAGPKVALAGCVGHRGRAGLPRRSRSALGPGDHRSAEPAGACRGWSGCTTTRSSPLGWP